MNTAHGYSPVVRKDPGPVALLSEPAARDGGNYSDDAIIARARRLIALRDLHIAKRRHGATRGILARLRAATAMALL
jgi:hypothetical protein